MKLSIDSNCKLHITEVTEVDGSESKLIFLKTKDDSFWGIYPYSEEGILLEVDGWYECVEKNVLKTDVDRILALGLIGAIGEFSDGNETEFFSLCRLRKCVLELEKETLLDFSNCKEKSEMRKVRDLLLVAIFVLENLICDSAKYSEAEFILNKLKNFYCMHCNQSSTPNCNCNE